MVFGKFETQNLEVCRGYGLFRRFTHNTRFGRNCCHSCHRRVTTCKLKFNGWQDCCHLPVLVPPKFFCKRCCANSLKAQRFFNYFEKLKKRWEKLMKHLAIREGENYFCLREIMFCEGVFVFREGVFCEGDGGVRRMAALLQPVLCCQSIGWPSVARVAAVWVNKRVFTN